MSEDTAAAKLNRIVRKVMRLVEPPEDLTVSEWAEKYRRLSPESSNETGPYRVSRTPYMQDILNCFADPRVRRIVVVSSSQIGKALAVDTPIPTPGGWTTMERLAPGDDVLDVHGKPARIIAATDVMYGHTCYRITFSDGAEIVADAGHKWFVNTDVLTTEQMYVPVQKGVRFAVPEIGGRSLPRRPAREIVRIEPVMSVPVKCIQVDSPHSLYLAGKTMVPTHNSELENCIIGYIIHQDPGSILFIHPTTVDAKEYSRLRIAPMIRDSPALRKRVAPAKSRDSANTMLQKSFPGGILTLCGSTEAHALASKPIRYVIGDERDRWAVSAGAEGDPWKLAMARQITFYNAKAVEVSTPTIKESSPIADSFLEGTMERWCVQCPNCGKFHDIRFRNIEEQHREFEVNGRMQFEVQSVLYRCPECNNTADRKTMLHQPAKWVAENPDAANRGVRSFWLNSFVSPWAAWEDTIQEYLYAMGSSTKLQVVYNTRLGELWSLADSGIDETELLARREEYEAELPEGVLALTCGVDTQDNRLEYEVVGHGRFGETWGIRRGIIEGRPDNPGTWEKLDEEVLDRIFLFKDGLGLCISKTFIDEGGHFTQYVRQNCQARQAKHVYACKGFAGEDRPYTAPPREMRVIADHKVVGTCKQYQIGVDSGKLMIMDNLKVSAVGARYCHFPSRDDYGAAFFRGLVSETQVAVSLTSRTPGHKFKWVKIPGHERNEPLDCRNYALAAFESANINFDAIETRLKKARGQEVEKPKPAPVPQQQRRRRTQSGLQQYFNQW